MAGLLSKERIVAGPTFNRWLVPPASIAIHLCIGSVYAWSIYNPALIRVFGVVTPAADDWSLASVVQVFTVAIVFLGLSAAFAGKWLEEVGPRTVGVVAACCWGGGYLVGGAGILTHQLWLLYLGYGVIGGCGLGLGYVSPVSTLIRWFPDRRGMAAGLETDRAFPETLTPGNTAAAGPRGRPNGGGSTISGGPAGTSPSGIPLSHRPAARTQETYSRAWAPNTSGKALCRSGRVEWM